MRTRLLLTAVTLAAVGSAQELCDRPLYRISSSRVTANVREFASYIVAAPKDEVTADPATGRLSNDNLVYTIWNDLEPAPGTNVTYRFLRSTDGGFSWDRSQAIDFYVEDTAGGEEMQTRDAPLVADGESVFVVFTTNRDANGVTDPGDNYRVWVAGSNDQGRTFQTLLVSQGNDASLSTGDQLRRCVQPKASADDGRCHIIWEAQYANAVGAGNRPSELQGYYYQAVEFDAQGNLTLVFPEERLVSDGPTGLVGGGQGDALDPITGMQVQGRASNGRDVGASIDVQGPLLVIAYQQGIGEDITWSRVSLDNGASFQPAVRHIPMGVAIGGAGTSDVRDTRAFIDQQNVYIFQHDRRLGANQREVFVSVSNDLGMTFTDNIQVTGLTRAAGETGFYQATVNGGVATVAYDDDRLGGDDLWAISDRNAGNDFALGTAPEILVADVTDSTLLSTSADNFGSVIVITTETSPFPENNGIGFSVDGGQSWNFCENIAGQVGDTDDPKVAITRNRDIVGIWQDDTRIGNTIGNDVYVRGLKLPALFDETASGNGIQMRLATPGDNGDSAILIASLSGARSGGAPLDPANGKILNIAADPVAFETFLNGATGGIFSATIQNQQATWLTGLPNLSTLIGMNITYAAVSVDRNLGTFTGAFSDPYLQVQ